MRGPQAVLSLCGPRSHSEKLGRCVGSREASTASLGATAAVAGVVPERMKSV
jgi:hypothetical protein